MALFRTVNYPVLLLVVGGIWLTCGMGWFLLSKGQGDKIYEKVDRLLTREEFFSRRSEQIFEDMLRRGEDEVELMKALREDVSKRMDEMAELDERMREEEKAKLTDDLVRLLEYQEKQRRESQQELKRDMKKLSGDVTAKLEKLSRTRSHVTIQTGGSAHPHSADLESAEVPGSSVAHLDPRTNASLYISTKKCLSWLQSTTLHRAPPHRLTNFHTFWPHLHTHSELVRRVRGLKSFFATQDLAHTQLHLWTHEKLLPQDQDALSPLNKLLHIHIWDLYELSQDSVLQFEFKEIDLLRTSSDPADNANYMDVLKLLVLHRYGGLWFDIDTLFLRDLSPILPVGGIRNDIAGVEFFTFGASEDDEPDCSLAFYLRQGSTASQQIANAMQAAVRSRAGDKTKRDGSMLSEACNAMFRTKTSLKQITTRMLYPSCFIGRASQKEIQQAAQKFALGAFGVHFDLRAHAEAEQPLNDIELIQLEETMAVSIARYSDFVEWRFDQLLMNGKIPRAFSIISNEDEVPRLQDSVDDRYPARYVSMSLYGDKPYYLTGVLENADLLPHVYPGWRIRVYVSCNFSETVRDQFLAKGIEVVNDHELCNEPLRASLWRFLIYDDPQVDAFVVRDADSRLSIREQAAVRAWLESPYGVHMMRDHPQHGAVMMAGMWGAKREAIPIESMLEAIRSQPPSGKSDNDQTFLFDLIYPKVKDTMLAHDSYECENFPNSVPFPIPRQGKEFVGSVCGKNNMCDHSHELPPAPIKCRGQPEWLYG